MTDLGHKTEDGKFIVAVQFFRHGASETNCCDDAISMAANAPETIGHLHFWTTDLERDARSEVALEAFSQNSRVAFLRAGAGVAALNSTVELMKEIGIPRNDMYEVAVWEDILTIEGHEAFTHIRWPIRQSPSRRTRTRFALFQGRERSGQASI